MLKFDLLHKNSFAKRFGPTRQFSVRFKLH